MSQPILSADIGGTNARFALLSRSSNNYWDVNEFQKFGSDDFDSFEDALLAFLAKIKDKPLMSVLSVAGPVKDQKVKLTNRNWQLDAENIKGKFGFDDCLLINDFTAMTRSVAELQNSDFESVKPGRRIASEPVLVAGPGTGFGVGYLIPAKDKWLVMTTEGGHQAYSPQSGRELELLQILQNTHGYISLERVSAGIGLPDVHKAVCQRLGRPYSPLTPAVIHNKAKAGDPVCLEVCEVRANAVMGALGDLALSGGARGGVVMAGGVSERMLEFLTAPSAMKRFSDRGDYSTYMTDLDIRILNNPHAALIGAAAYYEDMQ